MKISSVSLNDVNIYRTYPSNRKEFEERLLPNNFGNLQSLSGMPYVPLISFSGIQNSSKLRVLFSYGLPCMYSGVEMIDPKAVSRMLKNNTFYKPASEVVTYLSKYNKTISGMEAEILNVIRQRAIIHPNKNIKEILQDIEALHRKNLYKKQAPIFHELKTEFEKLPEQYLENFNSLILETEKRLAKEPLHIPFSTAEFKYKLSKIKDDLIKTENLKSKKVINKLIKESKRLSTHTNPETIEHQRRTLGMMDWVLRKSVLKDDPQLIELIQNSKARLKNEEIIIPFSRKSFIYDLSKIVKPLENKDIEERIISIVQKLPTSSQDISAYILKVVTETPEKIGFRILWPYIASVEHILPRSCGGLDIMANFGGATTRENSARKSIDFVQQLKRKPETMYNCQKYVDKLIELYHKGVFSKNRVNPKYIEDFRNTILEQSKGQLNLDISEFYKFRE